MRITTNLSDYQKLFLCGCFVALCFIMGCAKNDDEGPKVTKVEITSLSPASPATLVYYKKGVNDRVNIEFDYNVVEPDGVRIFIKAVSSTALTGTGYYSPSSIYSGTGNGTSFISMTSDTTEVKVDKLNIIIKNAANTVDLSEEFIDVDFTFKK